MPDKDAGWIAPAILRGRRHGSAHRPDVIFSSGPPWSGHIVAMSLASRFATRWVADFRDPWVRSPWTRYSTTPAAALAARLERRVVTRAHAVLFTTQSARDEFASFYGGAFANRFHVVANGCDATEFEGLEALTPAADRFVLLHAGTLYGGRSPLPLLEAAAVLKKTDPELAARLRIRFLGATSFPGVDLPAICRDRHLSDIVEFAPRVARSESLAEMRRASALLILQGGTSMAIPGKLYEYFAAGRPVLALCEEGEMTALIRARGLGLVAAPGDQGAIADALRTLMSAPANTWRPASPDVFDGRARAAEMAAILEDTIVGPGTSGESRRVTDPAASNRRGGTPPASGGPSSDEALTRPVRVMHLLFSLRTGGTEMGVVKLVNALDRSRTISSICSCKPADSLKLKVASDVPLFEFDRRNGNDPGFVLALARLLRRERPDVLHTHSWGTLFEGLVAARLASVPFVVHGEHGTLEARRFNLLAQRWGWMRADRLLSVSSRLADRMAAQVGVARARICVIRNGIDTNRFNPAARAAARQQLAIASDDVVIGTVGRLVPVKDQSMLLRAAAELKRRTRQFRLLLAGDGPLRDALQEQAHALGIQNEVSFLGERRDVEVVLAACDVFVLSSLSEGLSNTILEAMSTGLPVVATRVGGADELVDDGRTGVLVPPAQPDALATALASLIDDPAARRTMGAAGRLRAEREFSIARMAADYEALYATVAGGVSTLTRSDAGAPVCVA